MVNGQWLMRDRQLLTLNEAELLAQAQEYAHRIDTFLIEREQSVLSKLVALGGSTEEESFEVQVKVKLADPAPVQEALRRPEVKIVYQRHYHQHDNYFYFNDPSQGRLRYREDEFIGPNGEAVNSRARLTLIGPAREGGFKHRVLLSRSRYLAPATNSLRFYREYFKPTSVVPLDKVRLRWLVNFQDTEFYVNLDHFENPNLGDYLEIKSSTWSRSDAEHKAKLATELITLLGGSLRKTITRDYVEIAGKKKGIR
jgi:5-methylthioadenosine/S-adenosylhomocysteine deaminase